MALRIFAVRAEPTIGRWSKVAAKGHFIVRKGGCIVTKRDPVIPPKFTDMADGGSIAGHNGLGGLATGLVNVINCTRTDISFQFDAMVRKGLGS